MDNSRPPSTKLPAGLAGVLNEPEERRDSAYFSSMDPASKHNSTMSSNDQSVMTPLSATYQSSGADMSPSPIHTNLGHSVHSPASGGMSVASMVSPTTGDPSLFRNSDRHSFPNSTGMSVNGDSRRESVDSRLGHNFGDLRLANSPYASNNQSTTSIQSTLQQQRNPGSATDRLSNPRFSNSYQPLPHRLPDALASPKSTGPRTAPAITGPATGNIARAPEPTKGQAWAFPEEEVQRLPSAARPSDEGPSRLGTSFLDSRRSSIADSIASSQYTTESRLPPGQRRLDEPVPAEYQRLSRASSELHGVAHHHHSLQTRQISDLQSEDAESPGNGQPYSRTPELRVSHKLAERKRRTEMKELFETLRDLMPQERGSKASKWEILTKAIAEHNTQTKMINELKEKLYTAGIEAEAVRREAQVIRLENSQLRGELSQITNSNHQSATFINGHAAPSAPIESYTDPYARRNHYTGNEQLPPLRGLATESMTGVQYQSETSRANGYSRF